MHSDYLRSSRALFPISTAGASLKLLGFPATARCQAGRTATRPDSCRRTWRLRVMRADAGFYVAELLWLLAQLRLPFIIVARLTWIVQSLLRREDHWEATEIAGTEVAEWTAQTENQLPANLR